MNLIYEIANFNRLVSRLIVSKMYNKNSLEIFTNVKRLKTKSMGNLNNI